MPANFPQLKVRLFITCYTFGGSKNNLDYLQHGHSYDDLFFIASVSAIAPEPTHLSDLVTDMQTNTTPVNFACRYMYADGLANMATIINLCTALSMKEEQCRSFNTDIC